MINRLFLFHQIHLLSTIASYESVRKKEKNENKEKKFEEHV